MRKLNWSTGWCTRIRLIIPDTFLQAKWQGKDYILKIYTLQSLPLPWDLADGSRLQWYDGFQGKVVVQSHASYDKVLWKIFLEQN